MAEVIANQADAIKRADIAEPIDFRRGNSKMGIAHVIEQRDKIKSGLGQETAMHIPDVIARGKVIKQGDHKMTLGFGGDMVILTNDYNEVPVNRWVLAAFEKRKKTSPMIRRGYLSPFCLCTAGRQPTCPTVGAGSMGT